MKILLLDDDPERIAWFLKVLWPSYVYVTTTANQAIHALKSNKFDIMFLDHDLAPHHYQIYHDCVNLGEENAQVGKFDSETGYAVAKFLSDNPDNNKNALVFIHTQNRFQRKRMVRLLQGDGGDKWRFVRICPWDHKEMLRETCRLVCQQK